MKEAGDFIVEYAGRLLTMEEGNKLETVSSTGYRMAVANKYW